MQNWVFQKLGLEGQVGGKHQTWEAVFQGTAELKANPGEEGDFQPRIQPLSAASPGLLETMGGGSGYA